MPAKDALESGYVRRFAVMGTLIVVLVVGFVGVAFAQVATGTLTGTVTDAKGAAMAGVAVTVHNADTGIDNPVKTNDAGVYTLPLLQPGNYDVTASQTGFATVQNKGVTVQVGATVRIDIEMPVASQQSLVTVTTEAPLIETEKTEASQTVSENLVSDLPISSRRWEQFVMLTPGLAPDGPGGLISFHGLNSLYNNNSVDGANNNNSLVSAARGGTNDGYIYSTDSIKEFQVASSNYNAEVGQAAGAAVNAVTKSGTSQIHGDLFYNMRNPIFNALDPVIKANAAAQGTIPSQSVHQQNQFGGSVGGPIVKDKLFYFVTYDGYRKVTPIAYTTSQVNPPINGLTCPSEITTVQCTAAKDYVESNLGTFPRLLKQDVALGKLDYQLNSSNHLNAVFNWRNWYEPNGTAFASSANSGLSSATNSYLQDRFIIATWNTVIGNNKVNEVLYQFGQDHSFSSFGPTNVPPNVTLSNIFGYGLNNTDPNHTNEDRHQVSDNFSFGKGRHAFKTGVDMNFIHTDYRASMNIDGLYSYSGAVPLPAATGCPTAGSGAIFCDWLVDLYGVNVGDGKTGEHWTSYAQGKDQRFPGNANGQLYPAGGDTFDSQTYAVYFQDTWKARPNLTVNLGLRYDLQILPPNPAPNTNTSLLALYTQSANIDNAGVQPRLGVAWNFAKNTVLRFGFGTFYAETSTGPISAARRSTGLREQQFNCTPTSAGICAGLVFPDVLYAQQVAQPTAPFTIPGLPASQQPLTPTVLAPAGDNCAGNPTCSLRGISPNLVNPRALEGEVAIERQLPGNISLSASYVVTRGEHEPVYWDTNIGPATRTASYDVVNAAGVTQLTSTVPFFTTRLNPTTGPLLTMFSVANSWYNGMILTVRKPMSHGLELLANYTLSKSTDDGQASSNNGSGLTGETYLTGPGILNPYNLKGEQGLSGIDDRNRFTASVVWAPQYAKNLSSRYEKGLLDGWALSTTITASNGTPYSGVIQSSAVEPGGLDGGMTSTILSTIGSTAGGRLAWLPRDSFVLPSYGDVDLRLSRQFSIHERYHFEFRAEAFNLFNSTIIQALSTSAYNYATAGTGVCAGHVNTCLVPVTTFQSATTTTSNLLGARQLQFGIRWDF